MKTKLALITIFIFCQTLVQADIKLDKEAMKLERTQNSLSVFLPLQSDQDLPVFGDMTVTLLDSAYNPLAKTSKKTMLMNGGHTEIVALPISAHTPRIEDCFIRVDFMGHIWLKGFAKQNTGHEIHLIGQNRWIAGSRGSLRVIATNGDNGKPAADASINLLIKHNGKTAIEVEDKTDQSGTASLGFDIPKTLLGNGTLIVTIKSLLGENTVTSKIQFVPGTRVFLTTDKPVYQPGQVMHLRALTAHKVSGEPLAEHEVLLEIFDGKGNKVFKKQPVTSEFGIVSSDFQLADEVNQGEYRIEASLNNETTEKTVQVYEYVLPKFRVDIRTKEKYYAPGDEVSGSITSRYFFGKPVAGAKVTLTANCFDVGFNAFAEVTVVTDDEGKAEYSFTIPDKLVGQPQFKGSTIVQMDVRVRDTADHEEQKIHTFHVSVDPLQIEAIPESGRLVPGVENEVFLSASYPDGSVAAPELTVKSSYLSKTVTVQCDKNGIAAIRFTPPIIDPHISVQNFPDPKVDATGWHISTELNGKTINIIKHLDIKTTFENLLLRVDKGVYKVGDVLEINALSSSAPGETVFLDIIKNQQTVLTKTMQLKDGRSALTLPLDNQLTGSLTLNAYIIGSGGTMLRDVRQVIVLRSDDLKIDIRPDQTQYEPGQPAKLLIAVTNQQGEPVRAALGMNIVDESVYSLSEKEPGLAKVFFAIERELMQPKVEIHGYQLDKVVRLSANQYKDNAQLSKALLAKLDNFSEYGLNIDTARKHDQQVNKDITKIRRSLQSKMIPLLSQPMDVAEVLLLHDMQRDSLPTIDPWGRAYQIILDKDKTQYRIFTNKKPNRDQDSETYFTNLFIVSKGRDGLLGTVDDKRTSTYSLPVIISVTDALIDDSGKMQGYASSIKDALFIKSKGGQLSNATKDELKTIKLGGFADTSYTYAFEDTKHKSFIADGSILRRDPAFKTIGADFSAFGHPRNRRRAGVGGGMGMMGGMGSGVVRDIEGAVKWKNTMDRPIIANMESARVRENDSVDVLIDGLAIGNDGEFNGDAIEVPFPIVAPGDAEGKSSFNFKFIKDAQILESLNSLGYTAGDDDESGMPLVVNGQVDMEQLRKALDPTLDSDKVFEEIKKQIDESQKMLDSLTPAKPDKKSVRVRRYFPETLYYTPEAITDNDGLLALNLPMADSITTWRMSAMANAQNGSLGDATSALKVFKPFFVDLDLPVALIKNDEVTIPVAVYNYLPEPQQVRIQLEQSPWFELLEDDFERTVNIAANEVTSVSYRIQAKQLGDQPITVYAWGSKDNDAIGRTIDVHPNGEAHFITRNGRLSDDVSQTITLPQSRVDGADQLLVKIYPGYFSQVVEGLDAILKMPYGCFEQTSSTTYPNIMALDYMKSTGRVTPAVEMKAREYINLGYQRLLTFEVEGGGFQVFGNPPATRILSAYGLMEFFDMSKVHPVDANIIPRTQQWLFGQMNEDGTWEPDKHYSHAEMWKSIQDNKILSTAYIAMALAQTGASDRLGASKNYLVNHADDAKDVYTLSILCNTLLAIDKKDPTARKCVQRLVDMSMVEQDKMYWKSEASMSFARGNHASVETTAWAVLALIEDGRFHSEIGKALNWLIDQKDPNGTWGTTHGTVLALKALIRSVDQQTELADATIIVSVNGENAAKLTVTPENSDVFRQLDLTEFATQDSNLVEIELEGEGSLLYQVVGKFYLPWKKDQRKRVVGQPFDIKVEYDRSELRRNDTVTCKITGANQRPYRVEMVMIDIGIPPGFRVEKPALDEYVEDGAFAKYTLTPRQLLIYIESMDGGAKVELNVPMKATLPMMAKAPESTIYEYYNPEDKKISPPQELKVQ